jgi:hypothetical protein
MTRQLGICKVYSLLSKDFQNIKELPLKFGVKMLIFNSEQKQERNNWEMWLVQYSHMDKDTFKSFPEFTEALKPKNISHKSTSDILKEVEKIRQSIKG